MAGDLRCGNVRNSDDQPGLFLYLADVLKEISFSKDVKKTDSGVRLKGRSGRIERAIAGRRRVVGWLAEAGCWRWESWGRRFGKASGPASAIFDAAPWRPSGV